VGFLISVLIKFTIWYIRLMIWLIIALVVMGGWCIAATLSMLALAWLSAVRAQAAQGEPAPATWA
jgi:hypothetical protein